MITKSREIDKFDGIPRYHRWKPAALLRICGDDSFSFLQGQFSNDLRDLEREPGVYGLWLNVKGKVAADSFVISGRPNEYWVVSYWSAGALIRDRLEKFVIADDVVIEDCSGDWAGVTVFGPELRSPPPNAGMISFVGRRALQPCLEWVYRATPANEAVVAAALIGWTELPPATMEQLRVAARLPAVPVDIGPGDLPNEGGLDQTAVSYGKGCYLGQEVMARLKTMGQVRRRLLGVRGGGSIPPLPAALYDGDRRVGELRSATPIEGGFEGLALLTLAHLRADMALRFSVTPEQPPLKLMDAP